MSSIEIDDFNTGRVQSDGRGIGARQLACVIPPRDSQIITVRVHDVMVSILSAFAPRPCCVQSSRWVSVKSIVVRVAIARRTVDDIVIRLAGPSSLGHHPCAAPLPGLRVVISNSLVAASTAEITVGEDKIVSNICKTWIGDSRNGATTNVQRVSLSVEDRTIPRPAGAGRNTRIRRHVPQWIDVMVARHVNASIAGDTD